VIAPRERSKRADIRPGGGVSIFGAVSSVVQAKVELLRERACDELAVTCGGVSMEPAVRRGDQVAVFARAARVGDVAAFVSRRGDLELHRLLARGPLGWWVHGGDNQTAPVLGLVHDGQLVGVADGLGRAVTWQERAAAARRLGAAAWRIARRGAALATPLTGSRRAARR